MISVLNLPTDNPQLVNLAKWIEGQPEAKRRDMGCKPVTLFYHYFFPDHPTVHAPVFVEEVLDDHTTFAVVRKRVAHWKTLDAPLEDILAVTSPVEKGVRTLDWFRHRIAPRFTMPGMLNGGMKVVQLYALR
jgi:hypothetical protein